MTSLITSKLSFSLMVVLKSYCHRFPVLTPIRLVKVITADSPLSSLSFMDDGVTIASGTSTGKLLLFDLRASSSPFQVLDAHSPFPINCMQFQHFDKKKVTKFISLHLIF